jgi:Asp-tRNA(Asn)/Glu-tRNA(Gln) amidotransferase A subunit family amidase
MSHTHKNYEPKTARYLSFSDKAAAFSDSSDSPRAYLESCLAQISAIEPEIHAFTGLCIDSARQASDESTVRWRKVRPLSSIDGMPIGIKDCFDVRGMPTQVNSAIHAKNYPAHDAVHVDALRQCGAVIVGKTVTTEFTMGAPGPTWNPWDKRRTPGGSSSGSAAAVAARMLPMATGSQVRGSVIRPASICGVIGMKPTFGSINRHGGIDPSPSLNHLGFLGGTLRDVWNTAYHISRVAGGDPGYPPFSGAEELPASRKPKRLARQYSAGWPLTDDASKTIFEDFLRKLSAMGVEIVEPDASDDLASYEEATAQTPNFFFDIMLWEIRWPFLLLGKEQPDLLSERMHSNIEQARLLTPDDYRRALQRRERLRAQHRALNGKVDGFITLAHIGPGQIGQLQRGTPWYNDASSAIGAPTFNLPLLSVEDVPLGIQIMGFENGDEDLAALARWILHAFESPAG